MKTLRMFLMYMAIAVALMFGGFNAMSKPEFQDWHKETARAAVLYDAYEYYNDSGKPGWKGMMQDKATGTKFEWPLEPRQYRDFVASNGAAKDYFVNASKDKIGARGAPFGANLAPFSVLVGVLLAIFAIIRSFVMHNEDKWD